MKKRFWFDSKINVHCTQNTYPTIEDLLHKFSQQLKLKVEMTFSISSAKTDVKVVTNLRIPWVAKYRTNLSRKGKRPFIFWILIFPFDSLSLTLVYNSSQFRIYIHISLRNIQILLNFENRNNQDQLIIQHSAAVPTKFRPAGSTHRRST